MRDWKKRSDIENARWVVAMDEMVGFWPQKRKFGSKLSHKIEIGMHVRIRMVVVHWRV